MKENPIRSLPGIPVLLGVLVVAAAAAWLFFHGVGATGGKPAALQVIASAVLAAVAVFTVVGLYKVEPNQAAVLSLFGKYVGKIGSAHVCTPVTNAHLVCRLMLEKKKHKK